MAQKCSGTTPCCTNGTDSFDCSQSTCNDYNSPSNKAAGLSCSGGATIVRPPIAVTTQRSWTVTGRLGNIVQSVNVFANDVNQARIFASRQVPGFSPTSVVEFNACSAGVGTVSTPGTTVYRRV